MKYKELVNGSIAINCIFCNHQNVIFPKARDNKCSRCGKYLPNIPKMQSQIQKKENVTPKTDDYVVEIKSKTRILCRSQPISE